jgi:TonB family protein
MKKTLILLYATLFLTLTLKGQSLFFFGENSYPCTEVIPLQGNSDSNDLNVLFAKDGITALMGVSMEITTLPSSIGNIIIYLDDGTVIKCEDGGNNDYVDNITSTLYDLTNEQLSKLKTSNINTIRYTLKSRIFEGSGTDYSASNKGRSTKTDFPALLTDFFKNFESTVDDIDQETNARTANALSNTNKTGSTGHSEGVAGGTGNQGVETGTPGASRYGPGGGTGNISFSLGDRGATALPYPPYDYQGEGKVVVEVTVDQSGRVTNARSGVVGSTTQDEYLLRVAREAALKARFDSRPNTPIQKGTITYNFALK